MVITICESTVCAERAVNGTIIPTINNKNKKVEFNPQPDFYGENPKDGIRLIYKKVMEVPIQYMDDTAKAGEEIIIDAKDAPGGKNPDWITLTGTEVDVSNADLMPKRQSYFYVGRAYVGETVPKNQVVKVIRQNGQPYAITMDEQQILLKDGNHLKLAYHRTQTETPSTIKTVSTRDKGVKINLFDYNSGEKFGPNEGINQGKKLQFVLDTKRPDEYNRWTGKDGGIYTGIVDPVLGKDGYPTVKGESLNYLFDPEICKKRTGKDR